MPTTTKPTARAASHAPSEAPPAGDSYVLPVLHTRVPARAVNIGFWSTLAGSVVLGAIDPPLGVLLGVGVLVARHRPDHHPA